MPISVELWRAAVNRWVARIQCCLIIRRGMKRWSSCASSQEGAPSPLGQSHSGERKCMMKRKGRKKGKDDSFADAAITAGEVYDGAVTPAPISRWFGRDTLTDSSAWNLAGPALKELVCTGLGVLFAVIMILLLKSGDVEPNPGPLEGALPSVPEVLIEYEDEFFRVVYPKYNLLRLVRKEVITQDIATRISATSDDEGKEILYHHLKHHGSVHSLREFCEAAMAADGYPNMQKLAEKIVQRLSQGDSEATDACSSIIPDMMAEYVEVKREFVSACTREGRPTLEEVKDFCIDLIECASKTVPRISRKEDDIEKTVTLTELARVVCFRLSKWVSYDFFKKVIARFQPALKSVQDRLMCYEDRLKLFLQQKLERIAELQQREKVPGSMAELAVQYKLDADGLLLKDLVTERDFLAERLSIPKHLLQVISWGDGSIVITYWIVRHLLPLAELALCREDVRAELIQHGLEVVYLDSHPSEHPGSVDYSLQSPHLQRRAIVTLLDAHRQDLDVTSLTSDLNTMGILTMEQCQILASLDDKEKRHETLLYTLLAHDGPDTYDKLVECIGSRDTDIAVDLPATLEDLMKSPGALTVISSSQLSEGSGREPQVRAPPVHHGLTTMSRHTKGKRTLEDRFGGSEDQSTSGASRFKEGDEASSSKDHILLQPVRLSEGSGREPQVRAPPVSHGVSHSSGRGQESLRTKLGCYYPRGCVQDNPLLASSTMEHVRLNLVQPQQRRPIAGRESEAVTVRLARGGAGEVPDVRTPIEYENILSLSLPPGTARKRVLIEGVAGSGKTTLVQRICHDWSVGRFAQDYELVIKVTLRSLPKDHKLSLEDLIYTSVANEAVVREIAQYIDSSEGADVLFVFDGYDEMSKKRRQKSIISEIMAGRFAPLSSFVVTTRPISAERLYHCVDRRVEICGFGDKEVEEYITKYFASSNPSAGEKLLSALATRPSIKRLCYVPLLLLMVCFTAARGGDSPEVPPTMHQLYENIIILTVNYNLERAGKKERARSLQDVMQLCPSFDKVCLLALEGIENDTIIFSNISFEVDAALHGLVNCIEGQDRFGTTTRTWHTLHLTVQEYMAGLAVAKKSPEERVEFWRNHLKPRYNNVGRFILAEDRYKTTFLFYCGVSGLGNPGIQRMLLDTLGTVVEPAISVDIPLAELCEAASESENEEFAHSILSVCGTTVNVQDLNLQGVGWAVAQYCQRVEGVRLTLSSLASVSTFSQLSTFVSQLEPVCSLAAVHLNIALAAPPAPVDLENVKQFIQKQKHLKSFGLTVYSLKAEIMEQLIGLCKAVVLHHQRSLEEVVVGGGAIPLDHFVPALFTCPKLYFLKLVQGTLSPANTLMVLETLTSLQIFVLNGVSVDLWQGHPLTKDFELRLDKQVQAHPSLKALTVKEGCSLPLVKGAVAGMSKRGNVEKLIVKRGGDALPQETVLQAALMMRTGSLKVLEMGPVTPSQCLRLLKELPHCTRLQKFGIQLTLPQLWTPTEGETAPSCTAALLKAVLQCVSLEEVVLEDCSFDGIDDAVETFAKRLKDSRVTKLEMTQCHELSPNQIATLCRGLHWSRSLEELCINYDFPLGKCLQDVSDPGTLQSVEAAVRDNKSLKKMTIQPEARSPWSFVLTWNNVAVAILKGAAKNETLRTLRLWIPETQYPIPDFVDEVRRSNPKLQLTVREGQWLGSLRLL